MRDAKVVREFPLDRLRDPFEEFRGDVVLPDVELRLDVVVGDRADVRVARESRRDEKRARGLPRFPAEIAVGVTRQQRAGERTGQRPHGTG